MRKKVPEFHVTNVLATGEVVPDEIFLSGQCIRSARENQDLIDEYARQSSPSFRAAERTRRRFERVEARKQELQSEAKRIESEIERLGL